MKTSLLVSRDDKWITDVDYKDGYYYILTNDKGKNFRLAKTKDPSDRSFYQDIIPHNVDGPYNVFFFIQGSYCS